MRELWVQRLCLERLIFAVSREHNCLAVFNGAENMHHFEFEDTNNGVYGVAGSGLDSDRGTHGMAFVVPRKSTVSWRGMKIGWLSREFQLALYICLSGNAKPHK